MILKSVNDDSEMRVSNCLVANGMIFRINVAASLMKKRI
jgi:hypothetical protein